MVAIQLIPSRISTMDEIYPLKQAEQAKINFPTGNPKSPDRRLKSNSPHPEIHCGRDLPTKTSRVSRTLTSIRVRAPHLANPTIKLRCYSGRGGGFYPQSNIPPTACEPGEPRGCATCPVSALRSQRTQPGKSRSGNAWPGGMEPRTSALVPS